MRSAWLDAVVARPSLDGLRWRLVAWLTPGPRAGEPLTMGDAMRLITKLRKMVLDRDIELMAARNELRAADGTFVSARAVKAANAPARPDWMGDL
jgi:hypothetical protein